MDADLRLLCVCTHNRTRSVLMAALLDRGLREIGASATVRSAGVSGEGEPPTEETVRLLRERSIDVSRHRSRRVDEHVITHANLVVTAEHHHVVELGGRTSGAFAMTFTLPELVERGEAVGSRDGAPLERWLARVNEGRPTALDYLDADVAEIDDPTGRSARHWERAIAEIDDLTARLIKLLT
jgi:protein-tyrosine-phosphatase